jgi:hypothetical protein
MSSNDTYTNRTAVLFIGFKRYEESKAVIEAIRAARPPRFYFACDGARPERAGEAEAVEKVRSLAKLVDWPCEFKTRFSEKNQSVRFGPPAAIDWFFEHEEEGIILEDDCLPVPSWFRFAQEMLEHFRHDERVWTIMGNNLMTEWVNTNDDSYYYSSHGYGAYWGWAAWRRMWKKYDLQMTDWPALRDSGLLDGHFLSNGERDEAYGLLEASWNGKIHSWDFQLDYGRWMHGMVNVIPTVNLIRNIGFGEASTHTGNDIDPRNKDDVGEMIFPLVHPKFMVVDNRRDLAYFEKYIEPSRLRKFKNIVKSILPQKIDKAVTPFLGDLQRKLGLH